MPKGPRPRPVAERFWEKVDIRDPDECWPWTKSCNPWGYGKFARVHGDIVPAHRMAWELTHGPIPDGLFVLHHCDNPPCCNPYKCLFLGTHQDNMRDMASKGRATNVNMRKIRCKRGHLLAGENLYVDPNGWRECRTCLQDKGVRYRERVKGRSS